MATGMNHARPQAPPGGRSGETNDRPRVVLIEDNPLTAWAIERTLSSTYEIVRCSTLSEAQSVLAGRPVRAVICGSPITDEHPEAVGGFAGEAGRRVVALVSQPDCSMPAPIRVLEKPFDLARLARLLADDLPGSSPSCGPANQTLVDRLRARFRAEVCPVCIQRTADGGCNLARRSDRRDCPVFEWADRVSEVVARIKSDRLGDYLERIQAVICPTCQQNSDGKCVARDHLDCPLDLYLGLIVPIIEQELRRMKGASG